MDRRRAIITGASRGIGQVIARRLGDKGFDLLLVARTASALERLAEELRPAGVRVAVAPADLAHPDGPSRILEAAHRELGGVDVVVHNAAVELQRRFEDLSWAEIERVIRVDLLAPVELTRLVLPEMRAGGYGRLVFVSSIAGRVGFPFSEAYAASKDGLVAFTRVLRNDYRGTGVSASAVVLGAVKETGLGQRTIDETGMETSTAFMIGPDKVARGVVKAIEKDKGELVVMKGPGRLLMGLTGAFPGIGSVLNRASGTTAYMARVAEFRARQTDRTAAPTG